MQISPWENQDAPHTSRSDGDVLLVQLRWHGFQDGNVSVQKTCGLFSDANSLAYPSFSDRERTMQSYRVDYMIRLSTPGRLLGLPMEQ